MSLEGIKTFDSDLDRKCLSKNGQYPGADRIWYYFSPNQSGCTLPDNQTTVATNIQLEKLSNASASHFPEYDQIWKDNQLHVVAVFGKNEAHSMSVNDAGTRGYNTFYSLLSNYVGENNHYVVPTITGDKPGPETNYFRLDATLDDGKVLLVDVILIDDMATDQHFNQFYNEITSDNVDMIYYSGHAGYGKNIRTLSQLGTWSPGQYTLMVLYGCNTYSYIDDSLLNAFKAVNPDDVNGTKYLDLILNSDPGYFDLAARTGLTLIEDLLNTDAPVDYFDILSHFPHEATTSLVSGEEDNQFDGRPLFQD